jgi:TIGR00159 family protein
VELFRIGFLPITLLDLADVTLVAFLGYRFYKFFRRSIIPQVMFVLLIAALAWRLVAILNLVLLKTIMEGFLQLGAIALVVIFAPEIRRLLLNFTPNTIFERFRRQLTETLTLEENYQEIIEALLSLANQKTGALVVLTGADDLSHVEMTGDLINADISKRLITSIFHKNSPLHDGAVVIQNNQITAARAVLPLSDAPDLPPELGLRHRSALGITEVSDALALVVSEETGKISSAQEGKLRRNLNREQLVQLLEEFYG